MLSIVTKLIIVIKQQKLKHIIIKVVADLYYGCQSPQHITNVIFGIIIYNITNNTLFT